jgi:hypothetical protein
MSAAPHVFHPLVLVFRALIIAAAADFPVHVRLVLPLHASHLRRGRYEVLEVLALLRHRADVSCCHLDLFVLLRAVDLEPPQQLREHGRKVVSLGVS